MASLLITYFVPDPNGHGSAQRAMLHLKALAALGPVDLLIVHRPSAKDTMIASMDACLPYTRTINRIPLSEWDGLFRSSSWLPWKAQLLGQLVYPYCTDYPRLKTSTLVAVADTIRDQHYDIIFAFKLASAAIADQLTKAGHIKSSRRFVDFDDIMSEYKSRMIKSEGDSWGRLRSWIANVDCSRTEDAESRVLRSWDAASVCWEGDLKKLASREPSAALSVIQNTVTRTRIPLPADSAKRILFVGSFTSPANVQGLRVFVDSAWPQIRSALPDVEFHAVGLRPSEELSTFLRQSGVFLHANAPDLNSFYEQASLVICPVLYGSGTRIKILEAIAYGRAVVTTSAGVEGLNLKNEISVIVRDDMNGFAQAVIELLRDQRRLRELENSAHLVYCDQYTDLAGLESRRAFIELAVS